MALFLSYIMLHQLHSKEQYMFSHFEKRLTKIAVHIYFSFRDEYENGELKMHVENADYR